MKNLSDVMHGMKPVLLMILVQLTFAGVNVSVKLAVGHGMSLKVLIAYRYMVAAAFVLPVALIVERKNRPKLTPMIVLQGFLCGLFSGTLNQFLYFGCLVATSATFASAIGNLAPAATFILALIFRMEKLSLTTMSGKVKVVGTVLGIIGAMTLTFYKGVEFDIWKTRIDLMKIVGRGGGSSAHLSNHLLGVVLGALSWVSYGLWLIIQTKMSERYPCQYSCTALLSVMAAVQATLFALCTERDWSQWSLGFNIRLFSVFYTGALVSGMMISVIAWCVRMRGPLFVSVFNPLMLVMVALASSLLLNERLSVGSVVGAVLIVAGLYIVLWGKGKEMKRLNQLVPTAHKASNSMKTEDHLGRKSIEIVIADASGQHENQSNNENDDNHIENKARSEYECHETSADGRSTSVNAPTNSFPSTNTLKQNRLHKIHTHKTITIFSSRKSGSEFDRIEEMKNLSDVMHGMKPVLLMILVQIGFAGVNVAVKLAVGHGMSLKVLIAYRYIFAAAFVLPVALIVERKNRPKLTPMIVLQGFLCGLFGSGALNNLLYFGCLVVTSATFASAMGNLIPAATFILAVIFRMEKLSLSTMSGKLKLAGTVIGIVGGMTLTFYKGVAFDIWKTHIDLMKIVGRGSGSSASVQPHLSNHLVGGVMGALSCVSFGLWLIIQTKMSDRYPCQYSCTAILSVMAAVQATVFALCTERDWSQWRLGFNIRLFTVLYSGSFVSGMMMSVIAWCVRMRGPLFVSVFNPLLLVIVALASSLLLNERLNVGSVIGAVLIMAGLYIVVWGKGKEMKWRNQLVLTPHKASSSMEAEDLQNRKSIETVISDVSGQNKNRSNSKNGDNHIQNKARSEYESYKTSANGRSSKEITRFESPS
uniref:EamA domain-containing protein n=1 Tax=Kalanchoe fedtschenkoi TaxID=63787 RepID=A0A7N0TWT7_KALFE